VTSKAYNSHMATHYDVHKRVDVLTERLIELERAFLHSDRLLKRSIESQIYRFKEEIKKTEGGNPEFWDESLAPKFEEIETTALCPNCLKVDKRSLVKKNSSAGFTCGVCQSSFQSIKSMRQIQEDLGL